MSTNKILQRDVRFPLHHLQKSVSDRHLLRKVTHFWKAQKSPELHVCSRLTVWIIKHERPGNLASHFCSFIRGPSWAAPTRHQSVQYALGIEGDGIRGDTASYHTLSTEPHQDLTKGRILHWLSQNAYPSLSFNFVMHKIRAVTLAFSLLHVAVNLSKTISLTPLCESRDMIWIKVFMILTPFGLLAEIWSPRKHSHVSPGREWTVGALCHEA